MMIEIIVAAIKAIIVLRVCFQVYTFRRVGGGERGGGNSIVFLLHLINGRFVPADGAELIAHNGEDEEAVENGNDGKDDGV